MARIRSLHPEQWSDEQFVSCSPLARLLAIGIRNEADGLAAETLAAYKVAEKGRDIVLPSLRDGELLALKYLGIDRPNGKKAIRVEKDCQPCLWGWQAIPDNARTVTITEGELDAMSAFQMGFPALSVPFGGGGGAKQQWIEAEFELLDRFDTIYLALDNDQPGQQATAEIAERLGAHRCLVVDIPAPHKDINDLLQAGWTPDQLRALFQQARTMDPSELRSATLYADDVVREFYPDSGSDPGVSTPWQKLHGRFQFRPGEVCVLAGANGSGKSELAGHVLLAAMDHRPQPWKRCSGRECRRRGSAKPPSTRNAAWTGGMTMVKPVKKRGRPTLYRPMYAKMAYAFCLPGMDDNGLAEMFEVDEVTINRWKQAHPEFRKSFTRGKTPADAEVAAALYRSATGQHFIEEERPMSDGAGGIKIVKTSRQLPPEPQAQRMWLFNRQPHLWKNKVEVKEDVNLHVFPPADVLDAIYTKALEEAKARETALLGRAERLGLKFDEYEED